MLTQPLLTDLIFFLPECFFIFAAILLLLWNLFATTSAHFTQADTTTSLLLLAAEILVVTAVLLGKNLAKSKIIFYNSLVIDDYSTVLKIIVLLLTLLFFTTAKQQIKQNFSSNFEFTLLIMFSIFANLVLLSSNDLITFYLSIEMQSLCLYVLAAFKKASHFSLEAGLKYFVLGSFSSSLLLFGMSLIYGFTGSTNFNDINKFLWNAPSTEHAMTLKLGVIFLLCGFLFKLTAVPFHIWSPDVYEGAPLIVTLFFTTLPKLAVFGIFIKMFFSFFFNLYEVWQPIIFNSAAFTIIFASLATLYQKKLKRFLAYSSISHVGYMLIGLSTGTLTGLHSFFLYLLTYLITIFAFFGFFITIKKKTKKNLIYITDLLFLQNLHPINKFSFIIILFSMAGIPPLLGFFAKFYIFFAAIDAQYYLITTLAVLSSTLSAFYYIRIIKVLNFEKITNLNYLRSQVKSTSLVYATLNTLLIVFFIFSPSFLTLKAYQFVLFL